MGETNSPSVAHMGYDIFPYFSTRELNFEILALDKEQEEKCHNILVTEGEAICYLF